MNRKLTDDQVELLRRLYLEGVPVVDIAARLGGCCTFQNVSNRAKRLGLPPRQRDTGKMPQRAMVEAYRAGTSSEQIAARLDVPGSTVRKVLRANGVQLRGRHEMAKNLRAECVRLFRAGWFRREIAAKLGLTISQVRRRIEDVLGPGNKSDGAYRRSARGFRPSGRKGIKARLVKP